MSEVKTTTSSEHIFDVLRLVTAIGRPIAAKEVASKLGLSQTTAHRALLTLIEVKAIDRSFGGGKYLPGVLTHELLDSLYGRFAIRAESLPLLRRLAASTGETAYLCVPIGFHAIRIAAVNGWKPNRVSRVGKYTPLNASSAGRCALAFMPSAIRDQYIKQGPKREFTIATPVEAPDLQRRVATIRSRGYEIDVGGVFDDVASVAFPICIEEDVCIGTICLEGPRFQFDPDTNSLLQDWRVAVEALQTEVRKEPLKYRSPFAGVDSCTLHLP